MGDYISSGRKSKKSRGAAGASAECIVSAALVDFLKENVMQKVLDFLAANPVFQFATVDNGRARCRPFGFHLVDDNRIYFITGEAKKVCQQLKANPYFELSVSNNQGEYLRLSAKAVFDTRQELLDRAFAMMPMLKDIYGPGGPAKAAMFYAVEAEAFLADMQGNMETIRF